MSLKDKYDTEKRWMDVCDVCGEPVEMCAARYEVLGVTHDGCFGYPACVCRTPHKGHCPPPTSD